MFSLDIIKRNALSRLQREFESAKATYNPLRCVMIHQEGEDFNLPLTPPRREQMPTTISDNGQLFSYQLLRQDTDGKEIPYSIPTIGTGRKSIKEFKGKDIRHAPFAKRTIYLIRNRKEKSAWVISPDDLQTIGTQLKKKTEEAQQVFQELAEQAGRCFSEKNYGSIPGIVRDTLETQDDDKRWLWIVFDLAWNNSIDSPLKAWRWVWHDYDIHEDRADWGTDFTHELKQLKKKPKEAAYWLERFPLRKAWAERPPQFYYSTLDDLFTASIRTIEILLEYTKNSDWPPFPLLDIYNDDDPLLVDALYEGVEMLSRNYIPENYVLGKQLEYAIDRASDIRGAWVFNDVVLPEVPLPKNLKLPTKEEILRVKQWLQTTRIAITQHIDSYNAEQLGRTKEQPGKVKNKGKAKRNRPRRDTAVLVKAVLLAHHFPNGVDTKTTDVKWEPMDLNLLKQHTTLSDATISRRMSELFPGGMASYKRRCRNRAYDGFYKTLDDGTKKIEAIDERSIDD